MTLGAPLMRLPAIAGRSAPAHGRVCGALRRTRKRPPT